MQPVGSAALQLEVTALLNDIIRRATSAGKYRAGEDRKGRDSGEDELDHCNYSYEGGLMLV